MRKSSKELNVQLYEGYELDEEILVNYTEQGKQVMILDLGAPVSLAGNEWMDQYLKDHGLEVQEMKTSEYYQIFRYLVDADVPFLRRKREMVERWKSKIDKKIKV